jgi:phage-related minor tail protein
VAVTGAETQRAAEQKLLEIENAAVETEKKYGDGSKALSLITRDLNNQLGTKRLTTEAYSRALKEQTEQTQQAALAAQRYDDNLGSLAAGFQHAANVYARSNDLYSQGEQIFTGLTNAMGEGLDVLLGKSQKTFGQIAADFASMLAKMALQAAVSQVFKAIFGAATGTPFANIAGINTANAAAGLPLIPGLQHGGPVSPGRSYVVGEAGPELFVPQAAGNIVPSGAAGGSGDSITVNVAMNTTQGAADPASMLQFGRQVKAAIKDVIMNEKRPGGSLYSRVSA